jgi:hypothetical protein
MDGRRKHCPIEALDFNIASLCHGPKLDRMAFVRKPIRDISRDLTGLAFSRRIGNQDFHDAPPS